MTVEFILGHRILQGGYFTMKLPSQLTFVDEPECLSFSDFIDQDAKCIIDKELGMLTLKDGFKSGPYD